MVINSKHVYLFDKSIYNDEGKIMNGLVLFVMMFFIIFFACFGMSIKSCTEVKVANKIVEIKKDSLNTVNEKEKTKQLILKWKSDSVNSLE